MSPAAARRPAPAGFSLLELLVATALFAVLGALLFQVMGGAGEVWARGQRLRELEEQAAAVLEVLADDLRHLWPGGGEGRLLCTHRPLDGDGDGVPEQRATLLRFTRVAHEERVSPALRRAGETPLAQEHATLLGGDPATLLPTGGLAESLYTTATLPGEALPSLVRRVRMPVGGAGSLLDPALAERPDRLLAEAVALAGRVLSFELRFWGPGTTDWDAGGDGVAASRAWDSTRGILPRDDAGFAHGRGAASLLQPSDDVFPALVKVALVLDTSGDDRLGVARLAEEVGSESSTLRLTAARFRGGEQGEGGHLWIDGEWVAVERRDGRELTVRRGQRGSLPMPHAAGAVLRAGRLYERVLAIPAARERWDP